MKNKTPEILILLDKASQRSSQGPRPDTLPVFSGAEENGAVLQCVYGNKGPETEMWGPCDVKKLGTTSGTHSPASGPQLGLGVHFTVHFILQCPPVQDIRTEGPTSIDSVNLIW